ncbi:ROK family transcriptional regulator [Micromonospora echinofusca]|uniref:ROK family protein n=1 Tax=Micromonospora echinofusca TaxID=47858 RepID=A0ABS3VRL2_MICEH|nr:ROK family transcriptional regulator [Micromonospora echinofusca]MBO4207033.1 ROK family protein [Micromonospora echinofusca]
MTLTETGTNRPTPTLVSPAMAVEANRARVLQALYDIGPLSRADLARLTGATRATIGAIVLPLIERGLLVEREPAPVAAGGGKPARPLYFSPTSWPIGAVHLRPGRIDTALVSAGGNVLATAHEQFPARTRDAGSVVDAVVRALEAVLPQERDDLVGVGIAVGGMVDTDAGTIVAINLAPGLAGLPLGPLVSERIGLPVFLDLHPRAQALGDRWFGQGRGVGSFASIYTGEAIGVGMVLDGAIHRGPKGSGGEIGHTTVHAGGQQCRCGRHGCWETIATHRWLRSEAGRLGLPAARTMTTGPLARLAAKGHPGAAELFEKYAYNLALGIANLQQILAPGLFILHGDAVFGGEAFRSAIERNVRAALPPHPGSEPRIAFSELQDRATLLGGAGLVLSHSLQLAV